MPLNPCSHPRCRKRQRGHWCDEHRFGMPYVQWRRLRERLILAHIRKFGLRCPGADWHADHAVSSIRQLTVDHIIPRSRGGNSRPHNLRVVCVRFNLKRGTKWSSALPYRGSR